MARTRPFALSTACALVALLIMNSPLYAAPEDQRLVPGTPGPEGGALDVSETSYATGTVVSATENSLVIKEGDGDYRDFNLDSDQHYPAAMLAGDQVRVEYADAGAGEQAAVNVQTLGVTAAMAEKEAEGDLAQSTTPPSEPAATPTDQGLGAASETSPTAEMPATASPLPLVGLAGALALGLGLGVRVLLRQ